MELDVDRMKNLRLEDETVYPERDVIIEERRQTTLTTGLNGILSEQIDSGALPKPQIWRSHYRVDAGDLRASQREDAIDWYKTYYSPAECDFDRFR